MCRYVYCYTVYEKSFPGKREKSLQFASTIILNSIEETGKKNAKGQN